MAKRVLVYGGRGALGSTAVSQFKSSGWWVCSIDLVPNEHADANVVVGASESWTHQADFVEGKVAEVLRNEKVDAVVCVAGGWAGGNAASKDFVKNTDLMYKQSVWTSVISSQLAAKHMNEGGLLLLTGAKAALSGTPGMIGYGMAKAAVHQLVHSLSQHGSGLPKDTTVVGILPITLDTPANRAAMAGADFSQWTPLDFVARLIMDWAEKKEKPSSLLLQLTTEHGQTKVVGV